MAADRPGVCGRPIQLLWPPERPSLLGEILATVTFFQGQ